MAPRDYQMGKTEGQREESSLRSGYRHLQINILFILPARLHTNCFRHTNSWSPTCCLIWWLRWESICLQCRRPWFDPRKIPGKGNDYPVQYSCLENFMDRGTWWATVHGVRESQTHWVTNTFAFTHQEKVTFEIMLRPGKHLSISKWMKWRPEKARDLSDAACLRSTSATKIWSCWRAEIQRRVLLPEVLSGAVEGGGCSHYDQRKSASGSPSLALRATCPTAHGSPTLSSFSLLRVI